MKNAKSIVLGGLLAGALIFPGIPATASAKDGVRQDGQHRKWDGHHGRGDKHHFRHDVNRGRVHGSRRDGHHGWRGHDGRRTVIILSAMRTMAGIMDRGRMVVMSGRGTISAV